MDGLRNWCRGDYATARGSASTYAARYADGYRWSLQVAGLEEAFIYLMAGARDNFAADTPPEIAA